MVTVFFATISIMWWVDKAVYVWPITINNILWSVLNNMRISILAYHIYFYSDNLQHTTIRKGHLGI